MKKKTPFILILLLVCWSHVFSQNPLRQKLRVKKDVLIILPDTTIVTRRDTTLLLTADELKKVRFRTSPYLKSSQFYESLRRKAGEHSFSKDVLDLVVRKKKRKQRLISAIVRSEEVFKPFENLIIGSIVYKNVDLIEGSVIDTLQKASTRFGLFVNKVHIDTRARIIANNLLFKVGDLVNPYTLADNERTLRQLKTLRDVRIYVKKNKKDSRLVDVVVVTQDVGSIGVSGSYTSRYKYRLDLYDVNVLGYAKQAQVSYFRSAFGNPKNGYELTFREPNLLHTFIQSEAQYTNNYLRERMRLAFARDFFSPEIRYGGGLEVYRTHEKFYFEAYDTLESPYTENSLDLWVGRSFQFNKRTNLIFSGRAHVREFTHSPFISSDSNSFFFDRTLLLGSVTYTKRNFLKSLRIRGFGKTEDIPVGESISVVFGKEINEFIDRPYVELDGTIGRYFPSLGYIYVSAALGSFYKQHHAQDGLVTINSTYFSDLVDVRKMQLRQFVFLNYTRGYNRILDQTISISGKWKDDNGLLPVGDERIMVGLETVYFMPWYSYGFQFALFHRFDLNLLSLKNSPYSSNKLYSKNTLFGVIRAGARVLNENLVFPAFSLEVGYYAKNGIFNPAWEVKFSLTLPDLFGTTQNFKPQVHAFE